ncbi:RNA polymerase sigma factor [Bauldia litoralis]|uniref:RNA polymerase sigma factor n=1 Tax=Bauldia litoralis TaxID=665467 RepID=UPI0032659BE6
MAHNDRLLRLRPQLLAYARAICGPQEEADDLVQDAIERALKADCPPAGIDDLRPWMFRVIRNLHLDAIRRARTRREYAAQQERLLSDELHEPGDPLQDLLVRQAFEAVSPQHREVVFLVDIMGMRYAEAADVLAVAEGTVMSRLSRARRAILDRLDESNVAPMPRRKRN